MPSSSTTTQHQQAALAPTMHRADGGRREPPPTTTGRPQCYSLIHLLDRMAAPAGGPGGDRRLTRLLVNVTVDRSLWPLHLVLRADATVADLVRAAVAAYVREGRRPPLQLQQQPTDTDDAADGFELHFSKYSLESLRPEEKVVDLGSRNFFLCARRPAAAA
ncbi:hypothetical protein U9M48_029953 [Paspalum notatum var. saurae]|uniref:DUF7054 domain-containing protein n=1 Tax=Paspalum notatum var. saurae TaxID=547442 RepID=A0AAQ3X259_PASNO